MKILCNIEGLKAHHRLFFSGATGFTPQQQRRTASFSPYNSYVS